MIWCARASVGQRASAMSRPNTKLAAGARRRAGRVGGYSCDGLVGLARPLGSVAAASAFVRAPRLFLRPWGQTDTATLGRRSSFLRSELVAVAPERVGGVALYKDRRVWDRVASEVGHD